MTAVLVLTTVDFITYAPLIFNLLFIRSVKKQWDEFLQYFNDKNEKPFDTPVSIIDFAGAQDKEFANNELKEAYENAKDD